MFATLCAVYFTYNVAYPKGIRSTMKFLERFVFGIHPITAKCPVSVFRAEAKLKADC